MIQNEMILERRRNYKGKVVYIIGPYRMSKKGKYRKGLIGKIDRLRNIWRIRRIAKELWKRGIYVICPHLNTAMMDGICDDSVFLKGDVEILKRCDALIVGDENITGSEGCNLELKVAMENNIPVIYDVVNYIWCIDRGYDKEPNIRIQDDTKMENQEEIIPVVPTFNQSCKNCMNCGNAV